MVLKYLIQIIPMAKQVKTFKLDSLGLDVRCRRRANMKAKIQLWSESYCDKSFFYSNCQSSDWPPVITHCQGRILTEESLINFTMYNTFLCRMMK